MVNNNWLQERLNEIKENKEKRLIDKGMNPFWRPEEGTNIIKLFIDTAPKKAINSFKQPVTEWKLVEPVGYVWPTSEVMDEKILKAISPFFKLPDETRPPFVVLKVTYDSSKDKKERYGVSLA
jgi:hypothetical protein